MFDDMMPDGQPRRYSAKEGSGVIIDAAGDILTNEHVVGAVSEEGKRINVTLMDGRKFTAPLSGRTIRRTSRWCIWIPQDAAKSA